MASEVREAGFERGQVLCAKRVLGDAALHLERAHRGDEHRNRRFESGLAAFDVEEFLRSEIGAESRLGDDIIGKFERGPRRHDGIAAVGDVGERASMDESGSPFERLHEIGLQRVLEQRGHRPGGVQVGGGDRPPVPGMGDQHAAELLLELLETEGKAERGHHFGSDRDVEAVLARKAVARAKADDDLAKRAIVHVEHPPPGDAPLVEMERVAPVHVIVDHRRKQVVRRRYGVKIAGEMEVDLLHGRNLGAAPAGRAPLHSEGRSERRLAQAEDGLAADAAQRVGEADAGGRLALAGRSRTDRGDQNELAVRAVSEAAEKVIFELGDEAAERAQGRFGRADLCGDLRDRP